ncbi:hypothetical protein ABZY19_29070 [Streptomyces sp. NPDC006475]|uniref:hypothetical protein n=1 Tax=Streptomyces sp. NPDC006475 TaxID=3155719 RepID=UPI0033B2F449
MPASLSSAQPPASRIAINASMRAEPKLRITVWAPCAAPMASRGQLEALASRDRQPSAGQTIDGSTVSALAGEDPNNICNLQGGIVADRARSECLDVRGAGIGRAAGVVSELAAAIDQVSSRRAQRSSVRSISVPSWGHW